MINSKNPRILKLKLPNGQPIKVKYYPKWSIIEKLDHRADHFEFYGDMSDTGYYSHFVFVEVKYNPTKKELFNYIKSCIENYTNTKYGKAQQALF